MTTEPDAPAGDDRATDDLPDDRQKTTASIGGQPASPETGPIGDAEGLEELTIRAVQYPNGPTRCTMFPDGLTGMARLETWLSANQSIFVDLEEWR